MCTRVEEHAGGLSRFEVERDLVATADDRLAAALCHVVEEVVVTPERRFWWLLGCCCPVARIWLLL